MRKFFNSIFNFFPSTRDASNHVTLLKSCTKLPDEVCQIIADYAKNENPYLFSKKCFVRDIQTPDGSITTVNILPLIEDDDIEIIEDLDNASVADSTSSNQTNCSMM